MEVTTNKEGNVSVSDHLEQLQSARQHATDAIRKATEAMQKHYNLCHKPSHEYNAGDQVWLEASNIKEAQPSKKLSSKQYRPFTILKCVGAAAYRLELPASWKLIHNVFHESLLMLYVKPRFDVQKKRLPPPPAVISNELEYEVEHILDSRKRVTRLVTCLSVGTTRDRNNCRVTGKGRATLS